MVGRKIISLRKLVSDLRPIDILTGEIAIEVTGVVGVSPALWYFRYIASIFLTLHMRLWSKMATVNKNRKKNILTTTLFEAGINSNFKCKILILM